MEIITVVSLLLGFVAIRWSLPHMMERIHGLLLETCRIPVGADVKWDAALVQSWFKSGSVLVAALIGPVVLPIMAGSIIANMAQTGPFFSVEALTPRLSALNPVNGAKQLFSLHSLYGMGLAMLKVILIVSILFLLLRGKAGTFAGLSLLPLEPTYAWMGRLLFSTAITVTLVFSVIAALDYAYRHYTYERDMMMTKKEVEDERKNQELPSIVKGAQRRKMRDLTLARMMASVPKASVVIVNPTHFAVALEYDPARNAAPKVTAKGVRLVALRIRKIAEENGVPIVEKPELARALYAQVKVGRVIPDQFFGAVAAIMAHLYRIGNERIRNTVRISSGAAAHAAGPGA